MSNGSHDSPLTCVILFMMQSSVASHLKGFQVYDVGVAVKLISLSQETAGTGVVPVRRS